MVGVIHVPVSAARLAALEALVRRVAVHPAADTVVLRGGMVSRHWVGPLVRPVDDVDLLAEPPHDATTMRAFLAALPGIDVGDGASVELLDDPVVIWAENPHPGLRARFRVATARSVEEVQLDVGFGDPLAAPPVRLTLPTMDPPRPVVRAIPVETGIAWKLHGLFEVEAGAWRAKDLHDLDLFLGAAPSHSEEEAPLPPAAPLDEPLLRAAVALAFSSRDTPLAVTDRLFERDFGRSRGSRAAWEELRVARAHLPVASLEDTVERVAARLQPVVEACHPPLPTCDGYFPPISRLDDVWRVVGGRARFVAHRKDGLTVVNAEGNHTWPDPEEARNPRARHHRRVERECRGLVFGPDGALIARPYHKFFLVDASPETRLADLARRVRASPPRVLEKLDGAMVTAGRVDGALRLFTRRGLSDLARAAEAHLVIHPKMYHCVSSLVDAGYTPLFEWCANAHRLVVDHPRPRLVLTAVRDRYTGAYLPYDALPADDLDVVACLGRVEDLPALVREVRAAPEGEGVVLRWDDGQMVKIKADRYRRLHRAVESADPTRATWEVLLEGETDRLLPLLDAGAAGAVRLLDARIQMALAREAAWIADRLAAAGPLHDLPRAQRVATISALLEGVTGPRANALRIAAGGTPPAEAVLRLAQDMAGGAGARTLREWLA
jgi:hypothetical protein